MDHKLKLMVVDDSPLFRTWLIRSLSEDDRCFSRTCLPWILKCRECQALIF